ncbi:endonuclease [Photobacterium sp. CCB-ST2H9]|uniref:endonuclease n=1 Tax=Photobacterium sp. CCB-ST2H9 TaxID=2912855 RepID=UPI002005103C|nr:endonuclease [Photobacterium sp. CCB-ST2H9]UTM60286.1 endonuclease [Photobacterium sp. CCB-ST2H9]
MKQAILPLIGLITLSVHSAAFAQVSNGDFELWSNGSPDSWTTTDSGIQVTETSSQLHSGNLAAAITVNTGTQSETDFRQTVSVTSGESYDFSVWVYHTEGGVAARLYVDGYQGYSIPSKTGEWQQLSYRYTATSTGSIEVGLRFYDQSGFDGSEVVYVDQFEPTVSSAPSEGGDSGSGNSGEGDPDGNDSGDGLSDLSSYYQTAAGLTGYSLKTALYQIIRNHSAQSYSDLWSFYTAYDLDKTYEKDGTILDIYSENPSGADAYHFVPGNHQCGTYRGEGECYNREHAFPRSWFGGAIAPMNTDVHHIFPTDGYVNSKRSSYPYGEVGNATFTSANGSKLGVAASGLGYSGTVFEPVDAFKGDVARAYFYMATRYQNVISGWETDSSYGDAVLDGSSDQVFEGWFLALLLKWHQEDPVSQEERDRNESAYLFQGNRNPFVDYPAFVTEIWGK